MIREKAYALFHAKNPYPGRALAHHNKRVLHFALALAELRGVEVDEDLLHAGCALHDIGLFVRDPQQPVYLKRSVRLIRPYAMAWGLKDEKWAILRDILLTNHALLPVPGNSPMAEGVRCAVQVEHSRGLRRHGLSRPLVRGVFLRYPRLDFNRILLDFARIALVEDGIYSLREVFFPNG